MKMKDFGFDFDDNGIYCLFDGTRKAWIGLWVIRDLGDSIVVMRIVLQVVIICFD